MVPLLVLGTTLAGLGVVVAVCPILNQAEDLQSLQTLSLWDSYDR